MSYFDCTNGGIEFIIGVFFYIIALFGIYLILKVKRPAVFKINLTVVYLIPFMLGTFFLYGKENIHRDYITLLVCTFIGMTHLLYWREIRKLTTNIGYHKKLLIDFLDIIPDLVWMKDAKHRFTYTNAPIRERLLFCTEEEAYGKTSAELARMQRAKGHKYTFGEVCGDSDSYTVEKDQNCRFLEFGYANDQFLALQVFKAPLWITHPNGKKEFVGTIGMGRDLTYDYLDHEQIESLIAHGETEKALELFQKHKNRYLFTGNQVVGDNRDR